MKTKFVGVDVFVEAKLNAELPKSISKFSLKSVSSRGLKISGTDASILDVGWLCARYSCDTSGGEDAVADLLTALSQNYRWTSVVKLFEIDGKPAYT